MKKAYKEHQLEKQWEKDALNEGKLNQIAYAQTVFKDDESAKKWLAEKGIESNVIEAVLSVSFSEFIRLSLKALEKILPYMADGQRYDEAIISAGYEHHSQLVNAEKTQFIPKLNQEDFTNPVVFRAINQTRKLVNAIVKKYGAPMSVHIELARDLNKSFKERNDIQKLQKENQDNREQDIANFEERYGFTPKGFDLAKERLYREQAGQCAYSQQPIDLNRLTEIGYVEIDHALPYSRSFDNSFTNKVLVLTQENRNKGNQTPYEYLGGKNEDIRWTKFVGWVQSTLKNPRKAQKLLRQDFDESKASEFRERNLNDTRYAGRVMKNLIETHLQLSEESTAQRCVVVSGQLTAFLRGRWGLHKVREDGDKHHALDAAVVAACTHGMVKRLSDYARKEELKQVKRDFVDPDTGEVIDIQGLRQQEHDFPMPWPEFRRELIARLSDDPQSQCASLVNYPAERTAQLTPIHVSRMPTRRALGAAHQETIRSAKHLSEEVSSVKTPLSKISLKHLDKIQGADDPRNLRLIQALEKRLNQYGDKPDKAFLEPLYKPSQANGFNADIAKLDDFQGQAAPQIKSVRLLDTQKSGIPIRQGIANNGDMLRIDLFTKAHKFYAVPLYVADAVKSQLPNLAAVPNKSEQDWVEMDESYDFLFSVYPNDWLEISFKAKDTQQGYFSSFDRSTAAVSLWAHDRNQAVGKAGLIRGIGIKTALAIQKYHIDILGQRHLVTHELRHPLKQNQ